ncbi:phosphate/phosphite/phosphonate ABC transporter substrate-binding protein [Massilia sp. P8910]|uniref:phosphate/phosphite/phosphonate ABC transporter substrate-binding protein n=1 Tax=Massilia antarctica TaxID=2765360 RepID=UPI001E625A1A|nr:PhnD/SsuA/transferrin family substrate-binding protein [Massilia antarctica]MCE3607809.1 phosphate/phosphite/phosphonate ABC transporter substrate-binding protein [Massilia antarctica]
MNTPLMMGAVAYAPKVVTIWEGFKEYFRRHDVEFDYILYSNYERQVEAQFDGSIALAWNSPLAWVRAERMARARGQQVTALAMRDSDCDLTSVLVTRTGPLVTLEQLKGKTIGFGAIDSPQAHLIPLDLLRQHGMLAGRDYTARRFDVLGGKHGDHIGGERDAALALMAGEIDAAWMIDSNHMAFSREGVLPAGATAILARTEPFDHCNFTVSPGAPAAPIARFGELLLAMSWDDPDVRPLLELEGLKTWLPGRVSGYSALVRAVDDERFYDAEGKILAADYRY